MLSFNGAKKHLLDVLYVPEIHLNLFSQYTILDKGLVLTADSSRCEFRENEDVAAVSRVCNLFKLLTVQV